MPIAFAVGASAIGRARVVAPVAVGFDALAAAGTDLARVPIALAFPALGDKRNTRALRPARASGGRFVGLGAATGARPRALHLTAATSAWRLARSASGGLALTLAPMGVFSVLGSRGRGHARVHGSVPR